MHFDFDSIVVGSGFGGSVSAMRLSQKGYSVAVMESGKRWKNTDFPKTNWSLSKYLWMPKLGFYGIQRLNMLKDVFLVSGSGVGGGSLVYANTLYVPGEKFFQNPLIQKMGGSKRLLPFYEIAKYMLGVTPNPKLWEPDRLLQEVATEMGKAETFREVPVGIYFGKKQKEVKGKSKPANSQEQTEDETSSKRDARDLENMLETHDDPYFLGDGPARNPCNFCGGCMVGCRFNAKNTLDKNYLYFAEKLGAKIFPETRVTSIVPLNILGNPDSSANGEFGYELETISTTTWFFHRKRKFRTKQVVLSAGVMGTLSLLMKSKDNGNLFRLSDRLGDVVRTNSETVLPVTSYKTKNDWSRGIAITSSVHPDDDTHIEPVRYSRGSDFFGLLATVMVDGGGIFPRAFHFFWTLIRHPIYAIKAHWPVGLSDKSIILLVMQTMDNSVKVVRKRRLVWPFQKTLTNTKGTGNPISSYIPIANEFARKLAAKVGGFARASITDSLLQAPLTGHMMGGCIMGQTPEEGVIDLENNVFGYKNLKVCDGSMLTINLGVNPSLTITALSERAMATIPRKKGVAKEYYRFEKVNQFDKVLG